MSIARHLTLMQLMDSALPTGAFSHSFGLETYLTRGQVHDERSFQQWLTMFVHSQLTFTDALAIRMVYRRCRAGGGVEAILALDRQLAALTVPPQIFKATAAMGKRLLEIIADTYPDPLADAYLHSVTSREAHGHPAVAWALAAFAAHIDEETAVASHAFATATALTQNAVRGIPLGQMAGQRVLRAIAPDIEHACAKSAELDDLDLGVVSPGLEIAQMQHEYQRARMFMS